MVRFLLYEGPFLLTMIRLNPTAKDFSIQREVSDLKEVHALEEKGFVILQAGMRSGQRYFVMGKKNDPPKEPLKRRVHSAEGKLNQLAREQLEKGDQFIKWATVAVSLFAIGMGLMVIFWGLSATDPLQPLISRGWNAAMIVVGMGLILLGAFELVQIVILKRQEKVFTQLLEH